MNICSRVIGALILMLLRADVRAAPPPRKVRYIGILVVASELSTKQPCIVGHCAQMAEFNPQVYECG